MKYLLYDIALHILVVTLIPYFVFKMIFARKYRAGIAERLGIIDGKKTKGLGDGTVVWVHAVSVGETRAVMPVVKLLKGRNPGIKVVFSTVTATGNQVAEKEGKGVIDALIYYPLDLSWAVANVVRAVRPSLFVVVEKEIWPNAFRAVRRRGSAIVVANGTISERTFRRYRRFKGVFSDVLSMISYFCARTGEDLERALSSGISPDNAEVLGNLKFDLRPPAADPDRLEKLRHALGIGAGPVVVAGSTHEGEEEIILGAFRTLREGSPTARLVLAPRHPERFAAVEGLLRKSGLAWARRSRAGDAAGAAVVMLDTVGELMHAYAFADVAVVGGSLVPGIGGHNLLEPAFYGCPAVYGGHLSTYAGMADMLEAAGGGVRVKNERELGGVLADLLADELKRKRMGGAALGVVEANRGAAEKTVKVIERFLPGREARPGGA